MPSAAASAAFILFRVTAAVLVEIARRAASVLREKFLHRKFKPAEHFAGVLLLAASASAAAILGGHTDVIRRHEQLNVTLQANDGELPQRDKQLFHAGIQNNIVAKQTAERFRHFAQIAAAAAAALRLHDLGRQHQWVKCFCLCRRLFRFQQPHDGVRVRAAQLQRFPAKQWPISGGHEHTIVPAAASARFPPNNPSPCFYD